MTRKLAAILSADVVGYSRLMAENEDETVRLLGAYREQIGSLVKDHRGRVVDFTGDNFLAEFSAGADAVECAIEIQRVLKARNAGLPADRKMEFRIGAHMGDVRFEGERIYGDGVNIAARLEALAEPGGICISATVHEQVRNRLEVEFHDLGDQTVKNIPDQVHVYEVMVDSQDRPARRARGAGRMSKWVGVAAAVVVLLGLGVWASWPRLLGVGVDLAGLIPSETPALPDKPSVVVLPFANMSGDPEQEYFADGMTEDLTTALSQTSGLFVIARNSAFTYKGKPVKVEDVGRELGVRYVLEGSVRKAGDRVRITAQLIDATSGFHVWSEKYDRELADIFALQSEISERILGAVGASITDAELERIRRKPTKDMTAYDAFSQGMHHFQRLTRPDHAEARRLFERAIEIDSDYAIAVALLGATYSMEYLMLWNRDPALLDRAKELAQRSRGIDATLPNPLMLLASVHMNRGETDQALTKLDLALQMAPNYPAPHLFKGMALVQKGRPVDALGSIRQGLRLNPRSEGNSGTATILASVYANTGRVDEAVALWERARADNPDQITPRLNLAAHYEESGRHDEARVLVEEALRVNPDLTADAALAGMANAARRDPEGYRQNLRSAGLP